MSNTSVADTAVAGNAAATAAADSVAVTAVGDCVAAAAVSSAVAAASATRTRMSTPPSIESAAAAPIIYRC